MMKNGIMRLIIICYFIGLFDLVRVIVMREIGIDFYIL